MTIQPVTHPTGELTRSRHTPVTNKLLRDITRRIVNTFKPERIILFGSYAYGKPNVESDLDLLVITNRLRHKSDTQRSRSVTAIACPEHVTMDVFVRTPAEVVRRLKLGDPFFRDILLKGKVLYKRPHTRYPIDARKWRSQMPDSMIIEEWVDKAEQDYENALQILRRRKRPSPSSVCYNCQQCAEKYLKAFLVKHDIHFEKTHDLEGLNKLCAQADGSFLLIADWLKTLKPYAVETRYPGRPFEMSQAREATEIVKQIRKFIRPKLDLK